MYDAPMVKTFAELIGTWPQAVQKDGRRRTSIASFAADVGVPYYHAQVMRHRNSISVEHWPTIIAAAKRHDVAYTHEDLVRLREARKFASRSRQRTGRPQAAVA